MSDRRFNPNRGHYNRAKPKQVQTNVPATSVDPPKRITGIKASLGTPIPRGERPELFAPQALSKTESVPKDDPVFQHSMLVQGLNSLQQVNVMREHHLDFSQYMTILRSTHASIANGDKSFKRNVSLAMFEYYGVMLLWRRILYVRTELLNYCPNSDGIGTIFPNLAIPKEIGYYLEGIGNITDANGLTSYLTVLQELDKTVIGETRISGSFGKVGLNNHFMYETTPSPFVLLSRIAEDVMYTKKVHARKAASEKWDLHSLIRPEGHLVPNENLLGWRRAAILTSEQLTILDALSDVDPSCDKWSYLPSETVNRGGLPFVRNILVAVSDQLIYARSSAHNNYALGLDFKGSVTQEMYGDRVSGDISPDLLESRPISVRSAKMCCYHTAPVQAVAYAAVFRFRFKRVGKIGSDQSPDCLCYAKEDGSAPDDWMTNADKVFESTKRWNDLNFVSVETDGMAVASDYSRNVRGIPVHGVDE